MNEYYNNVKNVIKDWFINTELRQEMVCSYSWAIPSDEVINEIALYSPLIELGSGTGYWAKLINDAGAEIQAFDIPNDSRYVFNDKFYPITEGSVEALDQYPNFNLFLCWPCYARPWAYQALQRFQGQFVIYVGESEGGCCANLDFFELLDRKFSLIKVCEIPQWPGLHDAVYFYKKL